MPLRLILVRHGETLWNAQGRVQGFTDLELTERGRQQAQALAQALQHEPLDAVYSSPLRRALETARLIAQPHGLAVQTDAELMEMDQGELEGLTGEEMRRLYPELLAEWRVHPAQVKLPGGESLAQLQERAWAAIEHIRARHPEGVVVVVGHNFTNVAILCRVLGLDMNEFRRLKQDVAAMNIVEFRPDGAVLLAANERASI